MGRISVCEHQLNWDRALDFAEEKEAGAARLSKAISLFDSIWDAPTLATPCIYPKIHR